ncbi:unnamed protein product [Zymoseptoria tritici ST99CH_1E4]|uniref:RlpA-like protein double-psi beta-barrel domain-containing protein n=1 Tax=Zymoseptoria tritici ST99CH_1E4 TaxID=1276532 RepID=A0A2H1H591_ZYMTR|nr:unnamed protein product [Zymoseptoria tritici ST99CH_1E4]
MYTNNVLALTGLLVAAVAAVPRPEFQPHHQHHPKRGLVWVTEYQEVVETIAVTKTVWVKPSSTKATPSSTQDVKQAQPAPHSPAPAAPAYAAPAAQSEPPAPAYVAPVSSEPAAASIPTAPAYVAASSSEAAVVPTSTYVAPAPYVAPEASSAAAPAASSSAPPSYGGGSGGSGGGGSSGGGATHSGDITYFDVGMGACGISSTPDEKVVAISHILFDAVSTGNPNTNPLCNQKVAITGADGSTYMGTIVDRCTACEEADLDLSTTFFKTVTGNGDGRVHNMKWSMA